MTNEFLKQGDYNVFIVDWGSGSMALYGQATANTRVVGAMIAQMITFLQVHTDSFHMGRGTILNNCFMVHFLKVLLLK